LIAKVSFVTFFLQLISVRGLKFGFHGFLDIRLQSMGLKIGKQPALDFIVQDPGSKLRMTHFGVSKSAFLLN
jgi:hypothetical protein